MHTKGAVQFKQGVEEKDKEKQRHRINEKKQKKIAV